MTTTQKIILWGQVVATPGALRAAALAEEFYLPRSARLLSAYTLRDGTKFQIITEADRSSTCILLPEEY